MLLCFNVQAADPDQGEDYKQPREDLTSIALKEESEHKCYRSPEGLIYQPYNEVTSRVKHVQMHNTITPEVLCNNKRERKRPRNKLTKRGIFFCDPSDRTNTNKVHPDVIRLADQGYYALKEASLVELEQGTGTTNGNVTINNINYEVSVTSLQKDLYKYSLWPSNLDEENTEFITGHYMSPDVQVVTRVYGYTIHIYRREYINTFSPSQYTDCFVNEQLS